MFVGVCAAAVKVGTMDPADDVTTERSMSSVDPSGDMSPPKILMSVLFAVR